jgi:primosomal protein N'
MYAQVLVFRPIRLRHSPFLDYHVPDALAAGLRPGVLVVVPLRTQILPGMVMGLSTTASVPETRDIARILDPEPALSEHHLQLARWMAQETLAPLHRCVQVMLPPGMRPKAYLRLTPRVTHLPEGLPAPAEALLELLLRRGVLRSEQARAALRHVDVRRARQYLARKGYIDVDRLLRLPTVRPKQVKIARLALPRPAWEDNLAGLQRQRLYREILSFLEDEAESVGA